MTDLMCRYPGDREQVIVSYLYDDIDPVVRSGFEEHLAACARCRGELAELKGLRFDLGQWSPPQPAALMRRDGLEADRRAAVAAEGAGDGRRGRWQEMPAWARVAAAVLFIGVAAGAANLDVHYDQSGLHVRTGWLNHVEAVPAAAGAGDSQRVDVAALEQRLRSELSRNAPVAAPPQAASAAAGADLVRRVRAIVDESERRQQRELALRLGEAVREMSSQRQADLVRIDRSLGAIQNNTGVEMLRQRETINNLLVRTSLQK